MMRASKYNAIHWKWYHCWPCRCPHKIPNCIQISSKCSAINKPTVNDLYWTWKLHWFSRCPSPPWSRSPVLEKVYWSPLMWMPSLVHNLLSGWAGDSYMPRREWLRSNIGTQEGPRRVNQEKWQVTRTASRVKKERSRGRTRAAPRVKVRIKRHLWYLASVWGHL